MPWAIVLRLLVRLAAGLLFWRLATRRRRAYAGAPGVPGAAPKPRLDPEAALLAMRTSVFLTWRALLTAAYAAGAAVLAVAGVTIIVLTPRWLGAILLAAAIAAGVAAAFEGRVLLVALRVRRLRRRDERMRKAAAS